MLFCRRLYISNGACTAKDDVIWNLLIHSVSDSSNVMNTMLCEPHPFCCSWSCEMHVSNNEEMAFNYTEVLVMTAYLLQLAQHRINKLIWQAVVSSPSCGNWMIFAHNHNKGTIYV